MVTAKISQSGALRAAVSTDLLEVESAGGVSAHVTAQSVADLAGSDSSPVQSATVTLTAADLAVLDSVPFELVAAPGAEKVLCFVAAYQSVKFNGGDPFSFGGNGRISLGGIGVTGNALFYNAQSDEDSFMVAPVYYDGIGGLLADIKNAPIVADANAALPIPGAIATSSLNDGGADYVNGDTVTVDGGLGTLAILTITNAVAGVVQPGGYTLTLAPNGYLVATGVATTATTGIGTGLLIDIDTLDYSANPMTLTVKTLYSTMDV